MGGPIKKNKVFYFVSYENIRDRKAVDNTVTVPLPAMLRGDLSLSPTPVYDPNSGNPDGTGRTQFQVFPGDPNYGLCNTATNPSCLNIIPAARMAAQSYWQGKRLYYDASSERISDTVTTH